MTGTPQQHRLAAIGLAVFAVFSFTVLDSTAKHLSERLAMPQIVWGRFTCHFLLMFLFVPKMGAVRLLQTSRPLLQLARGLTLLGATTAIFFSVKYLPLAETYAVTFVAPFLVALGAAVFLREQVGLRRWLAILGGFAGVAIVLRPGGAVFDWAVVFPLCMATSWAACQLITRRLGPTEHPLTTLFYTALVGAVSTSFVVPFFWQPLALEDWLFFGWMGAIGLIGQLANIRAFALGEASLLAPFTYTQIVWASFIGFFVFGDIPNAGTLIGAAVIFASGLVLLSRRTGNR